MSDSSIELTINGERINLKNISPTMTLLEYLRQSGRVGTKEGCADGDCGACTVAIIGKGADGKPHYFAMNSCLIPLGSVAGCEIVTVEGIAKDKLHPVQEAMVKTGGSQCGYCTPGFIMSMFSAYYEGKVDDACVEGNLCRCTGYLAIRRAAEMVTYAQAQDDFSTRLELVNPELIPIDYSANNQHFFRPTKLRELFDLFKQHPEAILMAGGTDLGLEITHRRQHFPVMISLEAVEELKVLNETSEVVEIGAAVPLTHIEQKLHGVFPSMDEMLHWFAARQVRNRATLGGNIGTASPIGDLPPVLLSLDACLRIASLEGERIIALAEFFKGYRQTDLKPQEAIVSVIVPKTITPGAARRLSQSYKIGKRGTDDISIVAAAFTIDLDENNNIIHARLAYGGVAATPVRAIAVENMLIGKPWNYDTVREAKIALKNTFTPLSDLRGSAEYRKMLVANLFEKFFVEFSGAEIRSLEVVK